MDREFAKNQLSHSRKEPTKRWIERVLVAYLRRGVFDFWTLGAGKARVRSEEDEEPGREKGLENPKCAG
jgi:cell division protein FtsB